MTEHRNSVLAGIGFGLFFGLYIFISYFAPWELTICVGTCSGLLFGLAMYIFANSKSILPQTPIDPHWAHIIHSSKAQHFLNSELIGGRMYLLEDRIVFKSHSNTLPNHELEIQLYEISKVRNCKILGLIPNGLELILAYGVSEKLVVSNWMLWKDEIEKMMTLV